MASKLAEGMEKCLCERLDKMKQLPLSEITKLPSYSDEEVRCSTNDGH
jgi:hypothetical protein